MTAGNPMFQLDNGTRAIQPYIRQAEKSSNVITVCIYGTSENPQNKVDSTDPHSTEFPRNKS